MKLDNVFKKDQNCCRKKELYYIYQTTGSPGGITSQM